MTNHPSPEREPGQGNQRRSRRFWRRVGIGLGAVVVTGGAAGGLWLWRFIRNDLAPLVETSLSKTLSRPVEIGELEGFTLSGLQFGRSHLPPTAQDQDTATLDAIRVRYNLLEVLVNRRLGLDIELVNPVISVDQTSDGRWISTQITSEDSESFIKTELDQVRVSNGTIVLAPSQEVMVEAQKPGASVGSVKPMLTFRQVEGGALFLNGNQTIEFDVRTQPSTGGQFRLSGATQIKSQRTNLVIQGSAIAARDVSSLIAVPVSLDAGQLFANMSLQISGDELTHLQGTARFADLVVRVTDVPKPLTKANGRLRFSGKQIILDAVSGVYGTVPASARGTIHLEDGFNLTAQMRSVDLRAIQTTVDADLPIAIAGAINADVQVTGPLNRPIVSGTLTNSRQVQIDRVVLAALRTQFTLNQNTLRLTEIAATPTDGGTITGSGRVVLGEQGGVVVDIAARDLPADAIARRYAANLGEVRLGRVAADVEVFGPLSQIQTVVQWRAPEGTYPSQGEVAFVGDRILIRNAVAQVAGGTVNAQGESIRGQWQATVEAAQVQLAQLSPQLQGLLDGTVRFSGSLQNASLSNLRSEGEASFSRGLSLLDRPLTTAFRWLGDRLQIDRATAPGFSASGVVLAQVEGQGAPAVTGLDLAVDLQAFNLATLPVELPSQIQLTGLAGFTGRVRGTPSQPTATGRLRLEEFAVNDFEFEPLLTGPVQFAAGSGLDLDLVGIQDQIAVQLNSRYRPESFLVRRQEAIAQGTTRGDRLIAQVQNFPLDEFNIAPAANLGFGEIKGRLTGNVDLNLATLAATGDVTIDDPALGYIAARQLSGQFRYADGAGRLANGQLLLGASRFLLNGRFNLGDNPQYQGQVIADQGYVQDILVALQWFDLPDIARGIETPTYSRAADLQVMSVGNPNDSLINQLRRYSEILALLELQQQQRDQSFVIPQLSDLQGVFDGEISFAGSQRDGLTLDFGIEGQNWTWGEYQINQVIAEGGLADGVVTLLPLRLQSDNSFVNFTGQLGGEQQSGQLQAQNVPAEAVRDLLKLPVDINGNLNANAIVEGSLENPLARGEITLTDASINGTPIQGALGRFSFSDARLNFISRLVVTEPEPLRITGSIPYQFPFMAVEPESDALSLSVDVKNEGLALLNLFTDQVAWEGGNGEVDLEVSGTLAQPIVVGTAQFDGATVSAPTLPEPLTNLQGRVLFNRSLIQVESLQGEFRQGNVTAQGFLPIFDRDAEGSDLAGLATAQPLALSLNDLELSFKGLYQGDVEGEILISGTALAPEIGGEITLSNGRVELPSGGQAAAPPPEIDPNSLTSPPEFTDLRIVLGDRLRVTLQPVLNFVATGELAVNGSLSDLAPDGTIRLRSGQVNLFTTQLSLARGNANTATFRPEYGLDPELNVRLIASVPEVQRYPAPPTSPFAVAEISETPVTDLGAIGTVRIRANVEGRASQLFDNLELTSSPARSENEIILLLGGSFVDTLGQGDGTLAIANLAGSALLTGVQNFISNAVGLTDFRLFPTIISEEDGSGSTLELASELGVDISGNFSASVLVVLTSDAPAQFNLRYRLTDQFQLRGYLDTDGGTGGVLEFETRF